MRDIVNELELILEAIPGLLIIDKNERVIFLNKQCADYIRVNRDKSIGKHISEVFPPTCMPKMLKSNSKYNTTFYFTEGRMSVSTQVQLRRQGEVVGVLECDLIQNIDGLDDLLNKYAISLNEEMEYYREQVRQFQNTKYSINNILGTSKEIKALKNQIELAAMTASTVLITGETGTGKELVAHSLHNLSSRSFNRFVKVNASVTPESLFESELFGYEEGAFTGAKHGGKKGKFELAHKGTLFIDEINHMPLSLQPKLLRVLQEGEIEKIGSEKELNVDVRLIVATNENLLDKVKNKEFREDLYYRLNIFPIHVPPLRERKEDIPELSRAKVNALNTEMGKNIIHIEPKVYTKLMEYDWPGNVRELFNKIEAAMNLTRGDTLYSDSFNILSNSSKVDFNNIITAESPLVKVRNMAERNLIKETLVRFNNNKTQTAEYLKISRPVLYEKMRKLGISL